jgi:NosR/NirI family nitrous oxide reductase transcriptional regulator
VTFLRTILATLLLIVAVVLSAVPGTAQPVAQASDLAHFLAAYKPSDFFPDADRFGVADGSPAIVPVLKGNETRGFVYLNTDFANATGYSGKPIKLLVGISPEGIVNAIKLVDHKEPIVLIGIPVQRIIGAVNTLIGKDLRAVAAGTAQPPQVDIVSGATVTVLVMGDSVVRSAVRLIRAGRLGTAPGAGVAPATVARSVDMTKSETRDWQSLVGDGSVRRLALSIADVSDAYRKAGNATAAENPEPGQPQDSFIDLYVALVSVPTIGRSLLGEDGYARLAAQLKPGQQAIFVAGDGAYSFKGSGYVRGGIFDRIEILQDGASTRFRDRNHTRLGSIAAEGAPTLREVSLFVVPDELKLDPTAPWQLQLLVQRATGARDKGFITFDVDYSLPERYLIPVPPPAPAAAAKPAVPVATGGELPHPDDATRLLDEGDPLWLTIWKGRPVAVSITAAALIVLTGIFFFQHQLVRRQRVYFWVRTGYLAFTLLWLGWYANAQLSVVNVVTFTNALVTGFRWEYFLAAPLIFILWAATAAALLFWGRGPFCGWLCPFGALQELLSTIAKALRVPQITLPWGLHERLWPIKYMIFLGLFGLSLYSVALAETMAEVEPFKTAIILKFSRDWPFVLYAAVLLGAGLFIERFYCRYLCPLGAALAIPGRIRTFDWLRRWKECGSPCQRCSKECPVQAIHPEGHINVNECIYCMHCQELYHDDHRCPHMIQVRLKREKFQALQSPAMRPGGAGYRNGAPASGSAPQTSESEEP